ncbi:MAG: Choline-sulfatase [Candidatus Hydrogenedentes bacterium ADurb.Bin101]|nr:MAG: Choline-sulfatase [Candidatus Hydrogenedentes bacterium ADurb.Bin101]
MKYISRDKKQVTRRDFLGSAVAAAGAITLMTPMSKGTASVCSDTKPNILMVMTDQQTASALSCAGNPYVHTPALDALAARGVRFERAYVTQPLCMPCRSSLQTGRYPHEIGVLCNGMDMRGEFPMLGSLMADAGYENTYIGKWHVGTSFEKAGYTGEASDFRPDDRKTQVAVSFLRGIHEKPFFLTVSFMNPHNVCQLARGQNLPDGPIGAAPENLDALPSLPDNFALPDHEPSVIREEQGKHPEIYPTGTWGELQWRQYLWGYYRLVEKVDAEVGMVLETLGKSKYADNTFVVFASDHGEGIAMHHWNQKQVLYDPCTRVPLILAGPGIAGQQVCSELVSTGLDIPMTLLELAGKEAPSSMRGRSLYALALKKVTTLDRPYVVAETMFARGDEYKGPQGRMLRTDRYKYCVYERGDQPEQLFDMHADPGETNNLAVNNECRNTLSQHRQMLQQWAVETSDTDFPYVHS